MGEGDEVAGGVGDGEFAHPIKRCTFRHDLGDVLHGGEHGIEVVHFHVEIGGALAGCRGLQWLW